MLSVNFSKLNRFSIGFTSISSVKNIDNSLEKISNSNDRLYQKIKNNLSINNISYKDDFFKKASLNIEKNKKEINNMITEIKEKI